MKLILILIAIFEITLEELCKKTVFTNIKTQHSFFKGKVTFGFDREQKFEISDEENATTFKTLKFESIADEKITYRLDGSKVTDYYWLPKITCLPDDINNNGGACVLRYITLLYNMFKIVEMKFKYTITDPNDIYHCESKIRKLLDDKDNQPSCQILGFNLDYQTFVIPLDNKNALTFDTRTMKWVDKTKVQFTQCNGELTINKLTTYTVKPRSSCFELLTKISFLSKKQNCQDGRLEYIDVDVVNSSQTERISQNFLTQGEIDFRTPNLIKVPDIDIGGGLKFYNYKFAKNYFPVYEQHNVWLALDKNSDIYSFLLNIRTKECLKWFETKIMEFYGCFSIQKNQFYYNKAFDINNKEIDLGEENVQILNFEASEGVVHVLNAETWEILKTINLHDMYIEKERDNQIWLHINGVDEGRIKKEVNKYLVVTSNMPSCQANFDLLYNKIQFKKKKDSSIAKQESHNSREIKAGSRDSYDTEFINLKTPRGSRKRKEKEHLEKEQFETENKDSRQTSKSKGSRQLKANSEDKRKTKPPLSPRDWSFVKSLERLRLEKNW
jgi:hypothetical protein